MTSVHATELTQVAAGDETRTAIGRIDLLVVFLVGALMMLGVVLVYSASASVSNEPFSLSTWWKTPLRQCVFALLGFAAMLFVARLDFRLWSWERRGDGIWAGCVFVLAVALLLAMLIPGIGESALGARRALVVLHAPIRLSFQPAEFAKLALVVWLAAVLTRPGVDVTRLRGGYAPALLTSGILIGLTGIEDFGTAALLGVVVIVMLYMAGARWSHLIATVVLGLLGGVGLLMMKDYRIGRLIAFFSESSDLAGEGYQINQSLIAIGSGGWWGRGLGAGVQKYGYLPQDNNDFIFAIVCEELGYVGGLVIIGLFLLLLWRGWRIQRTAPNAFGSLLAAGITITVCLQAAFNLAVVTDCVPTKGISLPFVSAGGSGVLFLGMAAGLLASVGGNSAALSARREIVSHGT